MSEKIETLSLERIGKSIREKFENNDVVGMAILIRGQEAFNFSNWSTWWNGIKQIADGKFSFQGNSKTLELHATSSAVLLRFIEDYAKHLRGHLTWLEKTYGIKVDEIELYKKKQ